MKILATLSHDWAVFSVAPHDFVKAEDGTMADGGQPWWSGGYVRSSGVQSWIEVSGVDAAILANDYLYGDPRKYGVLRRRDVKEVPKHEWPDIDSFQYKLETKIWGTRGVSGREKLSYVLLKDCSASHLRAILETQPHIGATTKEIINHILNNGH